MTENEDRLRRFVQEARAASGLSHPHVVTIHEISEAATSAGTQVHYIAMEFVEGETLRKTIARRDTSMNSLLTCLIQTAEGLEKAHTSGIIHRDLKPENIMISRDGYAKILDFGLAKLIERRVRESAESNLPTESFQTEDGVILGTAGYISPEQVAGKGVDARSDIFSFGCILYEVITGRRAFGAETSVDVLHKILREEPVPVGQIRQDIPAELQRIIKKCLAKNPDNRYQSIKEVAIDLRILKAECDSLPRISGPQSQTVAETVNGVKKDRKQMWGMMAVAVILMASAGLFFYLRKGKTVTETITTPGPAMQIRKATTSGDVHQASISPDGKYVVLATTDEKAMSLRVRQLATGSEVQIVPPEENVLLFNPTFSPDGNYVYYSFNRKDEFSPTLYVIPALGGIPRKVIEQVGSSVSFSPDGKKFAFTRDKDETSFIVVSNVDGTEQVVLAQRKHPRLFGHARWSPDGKIVACAIDELSEKGFRSGILGIHMEDGREEMISQMEWNSLKALQWLNDGSGILATGARNTQESQIWFVSYPKGELRQITNDLNDYYDGSLTADSQTFLAVQWQASSNLWSVDMDSPEQPRQISQDRTAGRYGVTCTPEGEIIYTLPSIGGLDLWITKEEGTGKRQLTFHNRNTFPRLCDGRVVYTSATLSGTWNIWRMEMDGSNPSQLTHGWLDAWPDCLPGKNSIVFHRVREYVVKIHRISLQGGEPSALSQEGIGWPAVSPDGQGIAAVKVDNDAETFSVVVLATEGGQILQEFPISPPLTIWPMFVLKWSPDGKSLNYVPAEDPYNVWSQLWTAVHLIESRISENTTYTASIGCPTANV